MFACAGAFNSAHPHGGAWWGDGGQASGFQGVCCERRQRVFVLRRETRVTPCVPVRPLRCAALPASVSPESRAPRGGERGERVGAGGGVYEAGAGLSASGP